MLLFSLRWGRFTWKCFSEREVNICQTYHAKILWKGNMPAYQTSEHKSYFIKHQFIQFSDKEEFKHITDSIRNPWSGG